MTGWTSDDLARIGEAGEVGVASLRPDGTPRPYVTIWVVRVGQDLYIRSYRGRAGRWFQHAVRRREGRIRAGGVDHDVRFEEAGSGVDAAVDQAYQTKYAQAGEQFVSPMVAPGAVATTLKVVPR